MSRVGRLFHLLNEKQQAEWIFKNLLHEKQRTLPRNDLLSRLYWGTQWTMEIS